MKVMKHTGLLRLTKTILSDRENCFLFLNANCQQHTKHTSNMVQEGRCQPEGVFWGFTVFSSLIYGFLGRAFPVGLIFFHVIYGKAQAAELLTGRSSSLSCYRYRLKKTPPKSTRQKREASPFTSYYFSVSLSNKTVSQWTRYNFPRGNWGIFW